VGDGQREGLSQAGKSLQSPPGGQGGGRVSHWAGAAIPSHILPCKTPALEPGPSLDAISILEMPPTAPRPSIAISVSQAAIIPQWALWEGGKGPRAWGRRVCGGPGSSQ
jgi:hypothetical protein